VPNCSASPGHFTSKAELRAKLGSFIAYFNFNETMASLPLDHPENISRG